MMILQPDDGDPHPDALPSNLLPEIGVTVIAV